MFITTFFIIAKIRKKPRCPSVVKTVVQPDNGILFNTKTKRTVKPRKDMEEP